MRYHEFQPSEFLKRWVCKENLGRHTDVGGPTGTLHSFATGPGLASLRSCLTLFWFFIGLALPLRSGSPGECTHHWNLCVPGLTHSRHPYRFGTIFHFPQEPKAAGQLKDALLTWGFGEMANLIATSELFAICRQFLKVQSCYTACDCYPAPRLLFNIGKMKSYRPPGHSAHIFSCNRFAGVY